MNEINAAINSATNVYKSIATQISDTSKDILKEAKMLTMKKSLSLEYIADVAAEIALSEANEAFNEHVEGIAADTKALSDDLKSKAGTLGAMKSINDLRGYLNKSMSFLDYKNYEMCISTLRETKETIREIIKATYMFYSFREIPKLLGWNEAAVKDVVSAVELCSRGLINSYKDLAKYESFYAFFDMEAFARINSITLNAYAKDKELMKDGGGEYIHYRDIFMTNLFEFIKMVASLDKYEIKAMIKDYNDFGKVFSDLTEKELDVMTNKKFSESIDPETKSHISSMKKDEISLAKDFSNLGKNFIKKEGFSVILQKHLKKLFDSYMESIKDKMKLAKRIDQMINSMHETDNSPTTATFKLMDLQLELFNRIDFLMERVLVNIETASIEKKTEKILTDIAEIESIASEINSNYDPKSDMTTSTAMNSLVLKSLSLILRLSFVSSSGLTVAVMSDELGTEASLSEVIKKVYGKYICGDDAEIERIVAHMGVFFDKMTSKTSNKADKSFALARLALTNESVDSLAVLLASTCSSVMSLVILPTQMDIMMLSDLIQVIDAAISGLIKLENTVKKIQGAFMKAGGGMMVEAVAAFADENTASKYISNLEALALGKARAQMAKSLNKLFPSSNKEKANSDTLKTKLTKLKMIYKNYSTILKECGVNL